MVRTIQRNSGRMTQLMDDFLAFFRVARKDVKQEKIIMTAIAREATCITCAWVTSPCWWATSGPERPSFAASERPRTPRPSSITATPSSKALDSHPGSWALSASAALPTATRAAAWPSPQAAPIELARREVRGSETTVHTAAM